MYYKPEKNISNPFVNDEVFIVISFWVIIFFCFAGKYFA